MANILQIETATQVCSAAVSVSGKTVALKEEMASNIHAGSLTLFIDQAMREAGLAYTALDAIAVSMGPGSYTGLRIGVSTAKGLCFALDRPLIGVPTLEMMSWGYCQKYPNTPGLVCPMIDARRMEVYCALYTNQGESISNVEAKIVEENSFLVELERSPIIFIGDGAMKCASILQHPNASFSDENYNSATYMTGLAAQYFKQGRFEDVAYFEPFYLKDFVLTSPKKKV